MTTNIYRDAADALKNLPMTFRHRRRQAGLTLEEAAVALRVPESQLYCLENGWAVHATTLIRVLRWMDSSE